MGRFGMAPTPVSTAISGVGDGAGTNPKMGERGAAGAENKG